MNTKKQIPVCAPVLRGNEIDYVTDCLQSTWISSAGAYVDRFEQAFGGYCNVKHALSCCNGTAALHLALMALGVKAGDEVLVPTLTYVSTANAVTYCGAKPVFVDSEASTWNIDPALIEHKIGPNTKGIIVVHLYGHPVDMDPVLEIAQRLGLFVIEDAAEAHGALYRDRIVGSLGDMATFSFYGNKIISTGEGGMVVTQRDDLAGRVQQLKGQGMDPDNRYWFPIIGYNYRMTNIAAAIGLAQLEQSTWHQQRRIEVASWYKEELRDVPLLQWQEEKKWARHAYWMFSTILDPDLPLTRNEVMMRLRDRGIETRPVFFPMHSLPPYADQSDKKGFPVADFISQRGLSLPTWAGMTHDDVRYISHQLKEIVLSAGTARRDVL